MLFAGLPRIDFGSIQLPGSSAQTAGGRAGQTSQGPGGEHDPATVREMFLSNPHQLALLKERNPPLADALMSGDVGGFTDFMVSSSRNNDNSGYFWCPVLDEPMLGGTKSSDCGEGGR